MTLGSRRQKKKRNTGKELELAFYLYEWRASVFGVFSFKWEFQLIERCVKSRFLGNSVNKEGKSIVKLYTEVSSNAAFI